MSELSRLLSYIVRQTAFFDPEGDPTEQWELLADIIWAAEQAKPLLEKEM